MAVSVKQSQLITPTLLSLCGANNSSRFIPVRGLLMLPIEWKRPEKLPYFHPLKTGDRTTRLVLDMKKAPVLVEKSKEYENANDLVKKLFTFEFLGRKFATKRARDEMMESVQNHAYDRSSSEVTIAKMTARIRNLVEHLENCPRHKRALNPVLNGTIAKRRKYLRLLRIYDYKRFEWVLEKLDLTFTSFPEERDVVERKKSIRRLADQYCEDHKQFKLNQYKELLECQKGDFLRDKIDTLKWIQQSEIELDLEPTISDVDIKAAEDKLEQHLKQIRLQPVVKDDSRNILADV